MIICFAFTTQLFSSDNSPNILFTKNTVLLASAVFDNQVLFRSQHVRYLCYITDSAPRQR